MSASPSDPASGLGPKVFITYRREETGPHAGRLYDAMVSRFGEGNVFMDVDMAPGVDFVEQITEAVAACHVLIVVMGPRWATIEDQRGRARLADPEDFVRLEVETALHRLDVTPIPVLVSGAQMPNREELPQELRAITRRNAIELSDYRWRNDVGRLISTLDELLAESPGLPSPERSVAARKTPAAAAKTPGETAPPSTLAPTTPAEPRPPARRARGGPWLRWALLGGIALAAIVVAVVVGSGGGGSSTPAASFTEADLAGLVLPGTDSPGDLLFSSGDSGPYVQDPQSNSLGIKPSDARAYANIFISANSTAAPYWYSESIAAVFANEEAAQGALDNLKGGAQGKDFENIPVQGLGDDGLAVLVTGTPRPNDRRGSWEGSEYLFVWRTGNLLQLFDLALSGPGVSEDTARGFADKMDALTDR